MEEVKKKNLEILLQGFKGGGSSDPPEEAPNTLFSEEAARILDLISEGEIEGLVDGMKSVYVDDTPLQNPDGSFNFQDVAIVTRVGTQDQSPIPTFPSAENEIAVGVELKKDSPVVRNFTNPDLTSLRVRVSTPALSITDTDDGDTHGHSVDFNLELSTDNGPYLLVHKGGFYGKTNAKYSQSIRVVLPKGASQWTLRVVRLTDDATTNNVRNQTFVDAITEIIDANLRYPNSALIGVAVRSKQFQSVPKRGYLVRGVKVKVPSNYDPYTRTYTGNWDGSFKLSWTNNPAWIFYALATNPRWGLGDRVKEIHMDKWNLYQIGQHCDQMVPNGMGGMEPRYTINTYLQSRDQAYELLQSVASVFRGMAYYAAGMVTASSDRPSIESPFIFSKSNVVDGKFTYLGTPRDTRYSVAVVGWNDPEDMYRLKHEVVEDKGALARYGYKPTEFLAFGCTSRGQAQRAGRWALLTSQLETQICTWTVGLEALKVVPGSICAIQDADKSNIPDISGRISAATTNTVTLDRLPSNKVQVGHKLYVTDQTGVTQVRTISAIAGKKLTVSQAFTTLPQVEGQWAIETEVQLQLFRVLSIKDKGGMQFEIKATQHDPRKYDAIENATLIEKRPVMDWGSHGSRPRTPTELDINAKTVKISGQVSGTVGVITWESDVARHRVSYQRDNDGWVIKDVVGTSLEIVNFKFGTYKVSVEAINTLNLKSESAEIEKVVDSVEFSLPAPKNFRVEGEFTSSALKTIWDEVPGATAYTVRVYTSGVLRREVNVGNTLRFDYNYSDMKHDGGPWRTVNVQVMATGPFNTKSPWSTLTATNPQIQPLQGIEVIGGVKSIVFNCITPAEDDFAGILVWVSDNPDFVPTPDNFISDGLHNQVFIQELNGLPLEHKDYYIWAAGYDNFGKDSLNISSSAVGRPMVLELDPESITADMIKDGILDIAKFASSIRPIQIVDELPASGVNGDQVYLTTDGKNYRWHDGKWDSSVSTDDLTGKITAPQLDQDLQDVIDLIDGTGVGSVNERLDNLTVELKQDTDTKVSAARAELQTSIATARSDLSADATAKTEAAKTALRSELAAAKAELEADSTDKVDSAKSTLRSELETAKTELKADATSKTEAAKTALRSELASAKSELEQDLLDAKTELQGDATAKVTAAKSELRTDIDNAKSELSQNLATAKSELESNLLEEATERKNQILDEMSLRIAGDDAQAAALVITAQNQDEALAITREAVVARIRDAEASIVEEREARATQDEALARQLVVLEATVSEDVSAAIANEALTRATADEALTQQLNTLTSTVGDNTAAIANEASTRSDADSALATRATNLETKVDHATTGLTAAHTRISAEETARADADTALAGRATTLETKVNHATTGLAAAHTRITNEESARSTADSALATRATNLEASVENLDGELDSTNARVTAEEIARADADSALAGRASTLEGKVNHATTGLAAAHSRITSEESVRASADSALATRATNLESSVAGLEGEIDGVSARLTTEEGTRASADEALATRATNLESSVTNINSDISDVNARIATEETARADADTALGNRTSSLETKVNHASTGLAAAHTRISTEETARADADTALGSRATALETKVNHGTTGLAAAHTRITSEETARTNADTALGSRATNLETKVNHSTTGLAAAHTRITAEESARSTADSALATRATNLETSVTNLEGDISDTNARLTTEETTRANADTALGNRTTTLETKVNHATTGLAAAHTRITTEESARATADSALATRATNLETSVTNLEGEISDVDARVAAEETARADADSALASRATTLEGKVNHATTGLAATYAKVAAEETARANADTALGNRTTSLETKVNHATTGLAAAHTKITDEATARSSADTALGNRTTTLETKVNHASTGLAAAHTRITAEETARSTADSALATRATNLETSVTNLEGDISDVDARVTDEATARSDADTALATRATNLETKVNHASTGLAATYAKVVAEETARANADAALAARATNLEASVTDLEGDISDTNARIATEETTRADADTALGNRATSLETKVNHATTGLAATYAKVAAEETARANADTALATRATNLETKVNHATTGLAAAHARVTAEESARTSADSALATRATNLETSVGNLDAAIQTETTARISEDEAVAQKAETLRVAGDDAAAASMVMALRNQDEALTITTEAMKARFRGNEASIAEERVVRATEDEALASRITELKATVDGEVSAAIQEEALVRANADSALAGRATALETSVNHAGTGLAAAHTRISNEETARADADTALGNRTTSLESKVNHASTGLAATYAKVTAEETTRANADSALATRATNLESSVAGLETGLNTANSRINAEETTRADADSALASRATALETKVNHATTGLAATYAKVGAEETARADADTALANRATTLETKVNHATTGLAAAHSRVTAEETARTNADSALATRATNLESKVNHATTGLAATYAKVAAEETARANADSALASRTSTLETTVNGHTASISTQASSIDGLSAQYVVKVTTGGYISGYGLASTAVNGTPTSVFKLTADAFVIGQPGTTDVNPFMVEVDGSNSRMVLDGNIIATGSVTAGALAANSVTAGTIAAGAVSADQIAANAISVKHLAIGDLSNILTNGDQRYGIDGWGGDVELVPTLAASPTGKAIKLKGRDHHYGQWFSVKDGDVYYFSMRGASAGTKPTSNTGDVLFGLEVRDKAGVTSFLTACSIPFGTTSWDTSKTGLAAIVGNYVEARVWVSINQPAGTPTSTAQLTSLEVRRGSNGTMIQNGAITTQHITAVGISGDVIQANTLSGDRVIANTLHGDRIIANTINGDRIIANTIHGDKITAGTLGADKIGAGIYEVGKDGYGLIRTKGKTWMGDNNGFFFEGQPNGRTVMEMAAGGNNYFWLDYNPSDNQTSGAIELNGSFYADSTGYMQIDAVDVVGTLQLQGNAVTTHVAWTGSSTDHTLYINAPNGGNLSVFAIYNGGKSSFFGNHYPASESNFYLSIPGKSNVAKIQIFPVHDGFQSGTDGMIAYASISSSVSTSLSNYVSGNSLPIRAYVQGGSQRSGSIVAIFAFLAAR